MRIKSISQLKKLADKVFSLWIRNRERQCVTCGNGNNLQAGHYVSRSINQLRYDVRNVHTQCVGCNVFKRGNMDVYAIVLISLYGSGILKTLALEKTKLKQWKRAELESIIEEYTL